jgi:hypothetical protein
VPCWGASGWVANGGQDAFVMSGLAKDQEWFCCPVCFRSCLDWWFLLWICVCCNKFLSSLGSMAFQSSKVYILRFAVVLGITAAKPTKKMNKAIFLPKIVITEIQLYTTDILALKGENRG